jgi:hypothetical protein
VPHGGPGAAARTVQQGRDAAAAGPAGPGAHAREQRVGGLGGRRLVQAGGQLQERPQAAGRGPASAASSRPPRRATAPASTPTPRSTSRAATSSAPGSCQLTDAKSGSAVHAATAASRSAGSGAAHAPVVTPTSTPGRGSDRLQHRAQRCAVGGVRAVGVLDVQVDRLGSDRRDRDGVGRQLGRGDGEGRVPRRTPGTVETRLEQHTRMVAGEPARDSSCPARPPDRPGWGAVVAHPPAGRTPSPHITSPGGDHCREQSCTAVYGHAS